MINVEDYRNAPSGIGPLADEWSDKPHRLVYDLCSALEILIPFAKWVCEGYLSDDCYYDHHGYCQAHTLSSDCPVGAMKKWLRDDRQ